MNTILEDLEKPYSPTLFELPRRAHKVGEILDKMTFERPGDEPRQVRQLLIKMPGSDVKLPVEFSQCHEATQITVDHAKRTNPDYERSYAYFNLFRGMTQFSSYRGLSLNCHGDQLQGLRTKWAFKPDWSYIVSNTLPTKFFKGPFDLSEAVKKFRDGEVVNLYDFMNAQAASQQPYESDNFCIYLLSPYVVHSASDAIENVFRVFMKIAFSTKRMFDNRELRWNAAFDNRDWYACDTVSYSDGWFSHAHWNERFLKEDICPDWDPSHDERS